MTLCLIRFGRKKLITNVLLNFVKNAFQNGKKDLITLLFLNNTNMHKVNHLGVFMLMGLEFNLYKLILEKSLLAIIIKTLILKIVIGTSYLV